MSFFEFPHTRTYDSDLGWLIKEYEKVSSDYNSLKEFIDAYPTEYAALTNRIAAVENSMSNFQTQMDERFSQLQAQLSDDIYRQLQSALAEINTSLGVVYAQLSEIENKIIRQRLDLEGRIEATEDYCILYTDNAIQELIDNLPDLTTVNVFNPVRGEVTNIQTAINDLYDLGRSEALTALEYDSLGLTADDYDNLELTALMYDQYGRYYLESAGFIKNSFHYMTSPFTGEYVRLEVVINELASLHKDDALTATEYDALDIDADYYDSLDLSAYDYDWHGKTLVS